MIKGKKSLVAGGLVLALAASLVAGACAPVAPEEVEKVEFKTQEWETASYDGAGILWEVTCYMADYITNASDGRIVVTPSQPGAICPAEEQLDFVGRGATEAMIVWQGYYVGKIPLTGPYGRGADRPKTWLELYDLMEVWEGGRCTELEREEIANYTDAYLVDNIYSYGSDILMSAVPIPTIDDLKGVKFRSREDLARCLESLGASTVYLPGTEIYTALATGTIDGTTWGPASDNVPMSFHEVSKYWLRYPTAFGPGLEGFVVNGTLWKELPDDLKAIVKGATDIGKFRRPTIMQNVEGKSWKTAMDAGVEAIYWTEAEAAQWSAAMRAVTDPSAELMADPAVAEYMGIVIRWAEEMGY